MLRPKKIQTRNLITKKISATQKFPNPHNFSDGLSLRADNPTYPLLKPSVFPWFAQDPPLERADKMYIKLIIYHIFLDSITHLF